MMNGSSITLIKIKELFKINLTPVRYNPGYNAKYGFDFDLEARLTIGLQRFTCFDYL